MAHPPMPHDALSGGLAPTFARFLSRSYGALGAEEAMALALGRDFPGRVAVLSSFGAEAAALLALVADARRDVPVLLLETGKLFPETLEYQRELAAHLGLTDVRLIRPDAAALAQSDPDGMLHARDGDACCHLRKVAPLAAAIDGFDVIVTGRKRYQAATRAALPLFEADGPGRLKFNPLINWTAADIADLMRSRDLPRHPLAERGFASIGCAPCTTPVAKGEDPRAGRWRGQDKTECGIHFDTDRIKRTG